MLFETLERTDLVWLIVGPLVCLCFLLFGPAGTLPLEAWRLIGVTGWIVVWWLGEVIPLPATALLPIPLMPLVGIMDIDRTTSNYASPLIFLFLGGFLLGSAMKRWDLHRRIALHIVRAVGTSAQRIIGGFLLATAFLSMWISNTATAVMMFAVGISLVEYFENQLNENDARALGVALMLSIAYGASIGGMGTLIGTPPNALLASYVADNYDIQISFMQWMLVGIPIVIVMLPWTWVWLTRFAFPVKQMELQQVDELLESELEKLGPMQVGEKVVAAVFGATAFAWMTRSLVTSWTGLNISDPGIAIMAGCVLFAVPLSLERKTFALDWETAEQLPWGVLLLFGGGLAIADAFGATGLAEFIGKSVSQFESVGIWWIVLMVSVVVIFLTELTSNTATSAAFLPIMGASAVGLGYSPMVLGLPVAISASMAFMMPVATPPNAIVFAYDKLTIRDMAKTGFVLNLCTIAIVFASMYFLVPFVYGMG
jgi:sodium-dependent dicarboxylate transporter 2/3/5